MILPGNHPQRFELNDEVHARPPEALTAPQRISYLVLIPDPALAKAATDPIAALALRFKVAGPGPGANHFSADLGAFRVKWERHTEFSRYTFIVDGTGSSKDGNLFSNPAINSVPEDWVAALPGQLLFAAHAVLLDQPGSEINPDAVSAQAFAGNGLAGSSIGNGAATALTDFRIHADGFNRVLVCNRSMTPRQAGRMVQRLLEIDTYRLLALLAFPVARELAPFVTTCEKELAEITATLVGVTETDEPVLLDRLTQLEATIESRRATSHYRFGAAGAYYELVRRRTQELREDRIAGLQTFQEFTERRLAPAMNTCVATAQRQLALSERVARVSQLLSTRVNITQERQNRAVLEQMNSRAKLQLRLQETVEGLSIAAVTYYIVGLIAYVAKGAKASGVGLNADVVTGLSIPVVLIVVAFGVRQIRRMVAPASNKQRMWVQD